jgi:hypothetical protein
MPGDPPTLHLTWPPGLSWAPLPFPYKQSALSTGGLLLQGWGLGTHTVHVYEGACWVRGCTHVQPALQLPASPTSLPTMSVSCPSV